MTNSEIHHKYSDVLGLVTLLISLISFSSFATLIEDEFSKYLDEMNPSYQRVEEALSGDPVFLGQYQNNTRQSIAFFTTILARLTKDTFDKIKIIEAENEKDLERKHLILQDLKDQNTRWTNLEMPGDFPLLLSCLPTPITGTIFFSKQVSQLVGSQSLWVQVPVNIIGVVGSAGVAALTTASCFFIAPFYDAAQFFDYEPIQAVEIDLKAITKPYVITE